MSISQISADGMGHWRPGKARAGTRPAEGQVFCCCVQSAISLMKWPKTKGDIATDGNKRCPASRASLL